MDGPRYTAPTATNLNGNKKQQKTALTGLYVVAPENRGYPQERSRSTLRIFDGHLRTRPIWSATFEDNDEDDTDTAEGDDDATTLMSELEINGGA